MATSLFKAWRFRARRYLATRRLLRLYRDIRELVDTLSARAECPSNCRNFRTKILRLRNMGFIGRNAASKINRLSTMARKAGAGEVSFGELLDLVRCAKKWRLKLIHTEQQTRRSIPMAILATRVGTSPEWIAQNWLQREVNPLPFFRWCDALFVNLDTLRDWYASPALGIGAPLDLHPVCGTMKGGAA